MLVQFLVAMRMVNLYLALNFGLLVAKVYLLFPILHKEGQCVFDYFENAHFRIFVVVCLVVHVPCSWFIVMIFLR